MGSWRKAFRVVVEFLPENRISWLEIKQWRFTQLIFCVKKLFRILGMMASWKLKWKLKISYSHVPNPLVLSIGQKATHTEHFEQLQKYSDWLNSHDGFHLVNLFDLPRISSNIYFPQEENFEEGIIIFPKLPCGVLLAQQHFSTSPDSFFSTSAFSIFVYLFSCAHQ